MPTTASSGDSPFARSCLQQSGVLTTAQADEALGRGMVRGHLRAGRWRKICRGIVVTTNGPLSRPQQLWVAVLAAGDDALLAGDTALTTAGVRGLREGAVRIVVPAERKVSRRFPVMPGDMPGVRVVRTRVLPDEHRQSSGPQLNSPQSSGSHLNAPQSSGPPRVTTARALVDAASWAPSGDAARTIIAMTLQQRAVLPEEVLAVLAIRRRLPRARLIEMTVLDVAGGSDSLAEIDFKDLCLRHRLPAPDRQVRRRDGGGRWRFLDAYWTRWRVHAEIDGSHHMEVGQWIDDMIRQNQLWIEGDRVLRFPAALIRSRPDVVAGQVRSAVEVAGWQSPW